MSDDLDELFDATGDANDFDPHFEAALGHRVEMRDEIIEALTAQNRRLREALTEIEGSASPDHWSPQHQHCVDTARAALKGEPFNKRDKWGGYTRPNNSHPIGDKDRETGPKYIRADIACALPVARADAAAIRETALRDAIALAEGTTKYTLASRAGDNRVFTIIKGLEALIDKPGKETSHD